MSSNEKNDLQIINDGILPDEFQKDLATNTSEVESPIIFITKDNNAYRQQTPYSSALMSYSDTVIKSISHNDLLANMANLPINALHALNIEDIEMYNTVLSNYIVRSAYDVCCSVIDNSDVGIIANNIVIKAILDRRLKEDTLSEVRIILNDYLRSDCSANKLLYPEVNNNLTATDVNTYLSVIATNISHIIFNTIMYTIDDAVIIPNIEYARDLVKKFHIEFKGIKLDSPSLPIVLAQYLKSKLIELTNNAIMPSIVANLESLTRYIRYAPIGVYGSMIDANKYVAKKELTKQLADKELGNKF